MPVHRESPCGWIVSAGGSCSRPASTAVHPGGRLGLKDTPVKKIWIIAKREFLATVTTRGFIIGILMVPLLLAFVATVSTRLMNLKGPQVRGEVALIDPSGLVGPKLRETLSPE